MAIMPAINLESLVRKINSMLAKDEGELELGEPATKERGTYYPLILTTQGSFLFSSGQESETQIGYVKVRSSKVASEENLSSDYPDKMLEISLKLRKPLALKSGKVIPKCRIKLSLDPDSITGDNRTIRFYGNREDKIKKTLLFTTP